jgi:hypothetical protein
MNTKVLASGSGAYSLRDLSRSLAKNLGLDRFNVGSAAGKLGGVLGGMSQIPGASALGEAIGSKLGTKLSKFIGSGDYTSNTDDIRVNSLIKGCTTAAYPTFESTSSSVTMQHREFITDVYSPKDAGNFSIESWQVNPGLANTFPYLAAIAQNFELYRIKGMMFEYISSTSPYNTNSAMGTVILSALYNSNSPPFRNKAEMENSDFAISARPDKSLVYGLECASNVQNMYYIRTGEDSTTPITATDLCTLYFGTNLPSTWPISSPLGELWVTYDIEFARPKANQLRFGSYWMNLVSTSGSPWVPTQGPVSYGNLNGVTYSTRAQTLNIQGLSIPGTLYIFTFGQNSEGDNIEVSVSQSVAADTQNAAVTPFVNASNGFTGFPTPYAAVELPSGACQTWQFSQSIGYYSGGLYGQGSIAGNYNGLFLVGPIIPDDPPTLELFIPFPNVVITTAIYSTIFLKGLGNSISITG